MKQSILILMGTTALGIAMPAYAETAPEAAGAPEAAKETIGADDIIVTAQKRSERLSDVPVSITAATGEQLANAGITQVSDLEKVAPGLTFRPSTFGAPIFTIRGIGFYDVAVGVAPAVSIYSDQVPLPYPVMTEGASFDIERVEVLKGPQGTLFGQNSTGGAINYIPAKPTDAPAAGFDLTYGRFNQIDAQGFVSGPISGDLKGRIAVRHEYRDPWQISQSRPNDRLGRRDFTTGRMILDWDRDNVRLELNANGWINKSDTQAAQFVRYEPTLPASAGGYTDQEPALLADIPAPDKARIADWDPGVSFRRDDYFYQLSARADIDLSDAVTLTSISAYSRFRQRQPLDTDGVDENNLRLTVNADIKSFSQELRLAGETGRLLWMIGGNYGRDSTDDRQFGKFFASNSGVGPFRYSEFINVNGQKIRTKAVFGSLDYDLTDTLTAQVSARYNRQTNRFRGCLYDSGNGELAAAISFLSNVQRGFTDPIVNIAPGACVTVGEPGYGTPLIPLPIVEKRLSEDNLSWRAGLSWKPGPDTLLYANVTRGYKAGSFPTIPGLAPTQFNPVKQETVLAFESGFKIAVLDRKLQLTGAGFYYQYDGKQIAGYLPTAFGTLPGLVQIPRSSVRGAELGVNWRPVEGLTLNGGATYVDTRVDRTFVTNDPDGNFVDVKGESFPGTPKWQMNADLDYRVPAGSDLQLFMGGNVSYRSKSQGAFGGLDDFRVPGYAVLDLRLGVETTDARWKATLWGRNVTNKFYITNVSDVIDTVARMAGMPATYGVTLSYRY